MPKFDKTFALLDQLIAKLERNVSLASRESQKTPKKHMNVKVPQDADFTKEENVTDRDAQQTQEL